MHYLYKITNQLNKKVYIGQSKNDKYRWRQHCYFAKNPEKTGQYIHRAMAKYGIENFIFEIVATCQTQEDANEIESILIQQYNSRNKKYGYNLVVGGNYGGHSEETRQKLRVATTKRLKEQGHPCQGQKRTEEQRAHMSYVQQNERKNNYTPEMREQFSNAHTGLKQPEITLQKRAVSLAETLRIRSEREVQEGKWKCNAPECEIQDVRNIGNGRNYVIHNELRYCSEHGRPLKPKRKRNRDTGTQVPRQDWEPSHKVKFTEEQINQILNDHRSPKYIGLDFGVSRIVIQRIRKENNYQPLPKKTAKL